MVVAERAGQAAGRQERRRRRVWSVEEKQRIIAETLEPGASVSVVARRHDLNANMLFTWRREAERAAAPRCDGALTFIPAKIDAAPSVASAPMAAAQPGRAAGQIEIALAGGDRVIVGTDVDAAALARVIKVLSRR